MLSNQIKEIWEKKDRDSKPVYWKMSYTTEYLLGMEMKDMMMSTKGESKETIIFGLPVIIDDHMEDNVIALVSESPVV